MKIGTPKEIFDGENRVAMTPDSALALQKLGHDCVIESGAGEKAGFMDAAYEQAGVKVVKTAAELWKEAEVVAKVRPPSEEELGQLHAGQTLISFFYPGSNEELMKKAADTGASVIAMDMVPRISRAQKMDALSSMANIAGYRAVIEAAAAYGRGFPMMMTAAGTVAAAKVFVMGAGVAGLQAIATARRLGAVVTATDVRPAAKEQVESLGAKFVAVEDEEFKAAETAGGYAKQMSAEYQAKQAALTASHIVKQDVVITTALIPGRPAPRLVTADHVASMKPGSVIVDLAVDNGGNVEGIKAGELATTANGVTLVGWTNMPGRIASDASSLYARNLVAFVALMLKDGTLAVDLDDEILKAAAVTHAGAIVHEGVRG